MASLNKVRVQLLDTGSGAVLQEVDVLTSADAVTFADGQTFQQKLDAGLLKGATGAQGVQGATGATGTRGSLWYSGTLITGTVTTGTIFSGSGITSALPGDQYHNTATDNIYECVVGGAASVATWKYVANIKGATGTTGTRGSQWYSGTGVTGTSTTGTVFSGSGVTSALINDQYYNATTGNVYVCTLAGDAATAKWTFTICLKGATGVTGPAGADGASVKFGTDYASGTEVKLFLKTMQRGGI